jgi:hypothetical protein
LNIIEGFPQACACAEAYKKMLYNGFVDFDSVRRPLLRQYLGSVNKVVPSSLILAEDLGGGHPRVCKGVILRMSIVFCMMVKLKLWPFVDFPK